MSDLTPPDTLPEDDALITQTLGFSSFGATHPPSKKRRYNPRADAISLHPLPAKPAATGANSTPLRTNTDEIPIDDDDDQGQGAESSVQVPHESTLPQRPAQSVEPPKDSRPMRSETWYIGYYDPSTNQNPWDRLEKARGLGTRGTWLPHSSGANHHFETV